MQRIFSRGLLRACSLVCLAAAHLEAGAQQPMVGGIARDARTREPLECLHVALLDSTGRALAHTVTDAAGRFELEAPRAGIYRVRFEVFGWDPMAGPIDTLADGDFKQRIYPVAFTTMPLPAGALDSISLKKIRSRAFPERQEEMKARLRIFDSLRTYLRGLQEGSAWQSRRTDSTRMTLRMPQSAFFEGVDGDVIARFIVDSSGSVRRGSWKLIKATHRDFENAVKLPILDAHFLPARNRGQPVCELTQYFVRFELDGGKPPYVYGSIWIVNY